MKRAYLVGFVVVLVVSACTRAAELATERVLLPDLDQAAPSKISIVRNGERDLLVFASAVDNVGRGPLLVEGSRDRMVDAMEVRQLIRGVDGSTSEVRLPGSLRYVESATHSHWHLEGFERYELLRPDGTRIGRDVKTGFCLGDRYERRGWRSEHEPASAVLVGECRKGDPGALRVREGISPGYGDDYDPWLEGQYVDVTDVPPGEYVLVHVADPDRLVFEETRRNNTASALVRLSETPEGRDVEVLRACPDTARCA